MSLIAARAALTGGKKAPTAKSYVQNGLIAMWDGIENADWGTHDSAATTWKDLVGTRDIELTSGVSVGEDYMAFQAYNNYGTMASSVPDVDIQTVEFIYQTYVARVIFAVSFGTGMNKFVAWRQQGYHLFMGNYKDNFLTNPLSLNSYQYIYGQEKLFLGGVEQTTTGKGGSFTTPAAGINNYGASFAMSGLFKGLRIYSRALTAAEIAANYAIDKERFNLP